MRSLKETDTPDAFDLRSEWHLEGSAADRKIRSSPSSTRAEIVALCAAQSGAIGDDNELLRGACPNGRIAPDSCEPLGWSGGASQEFWKRGFVL